MTYPIEVISAASRVGAIFADGCDRCDIDDLEALQSAGLMTVQPVEQLSDTLEIGDEAWFFNAAGDALVAAIRGNDKEGE
jgi:hypothetical protein